MGGGMRAALEAARASHAAGTWDEAIRCYELALERLPSEGTAEDAANILRWVGSVRTERGEIELAREMFDSSLAVAELNGLTEGVASALICLAVLDQQRGCVLEAEGGYERAVEIATAIGNDRLAAMAEQNLGTLAYIRGEHSVALDRYHSALERNRRLGDDVTAAHALNNIAMTHVARDAWEEAEQRFVEAHEHALRAGDALMVGSIGLNRAELHLKRMEFERAETACREALDVFSRLRSKRWIGEAYKFLGILHRERGDSLKSGASFAMALGLAEASENCLLQAETQLEWSVIHLQHGRAREGIRYLNGSLRLFGVMRARRELLDLRKRIERAEGLYLSAVEQWATELMVVTGAGEIEHAQRVATLSCSIAENMGIHGWDLVVLRVGALLHDVGKTVISGNPPDDMATSRPRLLRAHPITGDAILAQLDFPVEVRSVVRHHHETVHGRGYPDALRGEEILLLARIVAVANAYDRLLGGAAEQTNPHLDLAARIHSLVDQGHDPAVVDVLLDLVQPRPTRGAANAA